MSLLEDMQSSGIEPAKKINKTGGDSELTFFGNRNERKEIKEKGFLAETVGNIPSSAGQFVKDITAPFRDPVSFLEGVGRTGAGLLEKVTRPVTKALGVKETPEDIQKNVQTAEAVGQFFDERYGGLDEIKNTIKTDPVGFVADLSAVLSSGGALIRGVGTAGKLSRVTQAGRALETTGRAIEPINIALKGTRIVTKPLTSAAGKVFSAATGKLTGAGQDAIVRAFKNPTPEFKSALRGSVSGDDLLQATRESLYSLKDKRALEYRSSLKDIEKSTKKIDITPVKKKIDSQLENFNITRNKAGELDFSRSVISDGVEANRVKELIETVNKWDNNTPAGLDILKQRMDDFYSPSSKARAIVTSVKSELRSLLNKEVPNYEKMTSKYRDTSSLIKDIESTLSLGGRSAKQTAIKKLTSALKQSDEFRADMIRELEAAGNVNILDQIAGFSLREIAPRGLTGSVFDVLAILGGLSFNPNILLGLIGSSPRVVGEFVRALGLTNKQVNAIVDFITKPEFTNIRQALIQTRGVTQE